ncbi:transglutaminase-like domain-containing protein [Bremerella sp. T1]|uniref:transglutaminase-like domain-containing protein n=1 Tax=Bremerella sp. TYQ1 TaxID=3119568 RepID=UPI001CCD8B8A|nr:transglutaminase family protein [Bremerella volcania]UBM36255.1 transglutaminase family protein [Bremerella volcania]
MVRSLAKRPFPALLLLLIVFSGNVSAQFGPAPSIGTQDNDPNVFETGFTLQVAGPALGVSATFPVPAAWEDQTVELIDQQLHPASANLRFVDLDGTKQARVDIPRMAAGDSAKVLLRFRVDRKPIEAPAQPQKLTVPGTKDLARDARKFLLPSPFIESRDSKIAALATSLAPPNASIWEKAEAYYDYVHENVTYENGPMKGALAALDEGRGDCEEMTTLFVALCRAGEIPARTVWVPGHCYPEFLTQTADGENRWVAVEMTSNFPFGVSPEKRPILQKGDNFRIPGNRRPQHYVKQELAIRDYKGTAPPVISWLPPETKEPPRAN